MKNVLPENRDVNQKGGSGNQDNQPRREFLSEGDREIPDIAGQRIGQKKLEKRMKSCRDGSLWEKNDKLLDEFEWINNNFPVLFKSLGINQRFSKN